MKKALLIVLILCLVATPAFARRCRTTTVQEVGDDGTSVTGIKLDAPNLVKIDKEGEWTLGLEGGKQIMRGIFGDERDYVEADKGFFAFLKVTYKGCLLNCGEE